MYVVCSEFPISTNAPVDMDKLIPITVLSNDYCLHHQWFFRLPVYCQEFYENIYHILNLQQENYIATPLYIGTMASQQYK